VEQTLADARHRKDTALSSRKVRVAAAALAITLLAAACSSSKDKSGGDTGSAGNSGGSTSNGGSSGGGDIVVGGVQDGNFTGIDVGFKARIARFNNDGGLDGRKIKLLDVLKDGNSLSGNLTAVQTLVLKNKVFAVTPIASQTFSPSSAQLLNQRNIPFIGWGINPSMCIGDAAFPVMGCQASSQYQSLLLYKELADGVGKPAKGLKVAIVGIDNAGGKSGVDGLSAATKQAGADLVYNKASIPQGGATDYSPYVQGLLAANPDVVMLLTDFGPGAALTASLRQAGYKGGIWNPTAYVPGILDKQPQLAQALNGSLVVAQFPTQEEGAPAAKQVETDLKAINAPTEMTLGVSTGWWSAEEFIQELQATLAKGEVTSANFVKTIHAGWTIKPLVGGISDLTFPNHQDKPVGCGGLMQSDAKGAYVLKVKYQCSPSDTVKLTGG
jgi:ABC-type branched-subunit amino acid transport system substrate-binding protein